jgi:DNA polymerase-3 subunit gamma/tau
VFENIIAQDASSQLASDLRSGRLAPSMLFFGPDSTGKGSAALELARSLSCGEDAAWNCSCASCMRHRSLLHGDLLMLGPRAFSPEIAAASSAFLREPAASATRALFIRSLRKLMARFSPVLLEDDPKQGKLSPLLQSLEEGLDEFESLADGSGAEKICEKLQKDALKLESEGMSELIPINHIRRAAYWSRLAPNGKRKLLLIENADRMREEARNSLLKLLEEPPATLNIVLTSQRREAIMPTLLSRLRPYRFLKRESEKEREVIRRVFRDAEWGASSASDSGGGIISAYLETFLPQNTEKLDQLAAYFIASVARAAALELKKKGVREIPAFVSALGSRYAPIADGAGFERSLRAKDVIKTLLASSDNFEGRSSSRFLKTALDLVSAAAREGAPGPQALAYNDIWRKYSAEAETAMNVLNQSPALALEAYFFRLTQVLANG